MKFFFLFFDGNIILRIVLDTGPDLELKCSHSFRMSAPGQDIVIPLFCLGIGVDIDDKCKGVYGVGLALNLPAGARQE